MEPEGKRTLVYYAYALYVLGSWLWVYLSGKRRRAFWVPFGLVTGYLLAVKLL